MSKPIKLTDELLQKIQEEFVAKVKSMKMFDGKLKYEREFKWDDSDTDRATIYLSSVAFAKMNALIQQFDSEVAWHGVVERDQEDPSIFRITDILVYPRLLLVLRSTLIRKPIRLGCILSTMTCSTICVCRGIVTSICP